MTLPKFAISYKIQFFHSIFHELAFLKENIAELLIVIHALMSQIDTFETLDALIL